MKNALFAWSLLLVSIVAASGCTMCAHPYDYCGPTYDGGNSVNCDFNARACSILSPNLYACDGCASGGCQSCGQPVIDGNVIEENPQPTPANPLNGYSQNQSMPGVHDRVEFLNTSPQSQWTTSAGYNTRWR